MDTADSVSTAYALAATLATLSSNARMAQLLMGIHDNTGVRALLLLTLKETEQEESGFHQLATNGVPFLLVCGRNWKCCSPACLRCVGKGSLSGVLLCSPKGSPALSYRTSLYLFVATSAYVSSSSHSLVFLPIRNLYFRVLKLYLNAYCPVASPVVYANSCTSRVKS